MHILELHSHFLMNHKWHVLHKTIFHGRYMYICNTSSSTITPASLCPILSFVMDIVTILVSSHSPSSRVKVMWFSTSNSQSWSTSSLGASSSWSLSNSFFPLHSFWGAETFLTQTAPSSLIYRLLSGNKTSSSCRVARCAPKGTVFVNPERLVITKYVRPSFKGGNTSSSIITPASLSNTSSPSTSMVWCDCGKWGWPSTWTETTALTPGGSLSDSSRKAHTLGTSAGPIGSMLECIPRA